MTAKKKILFGVTSLCLVMVVTITSVSIVLASLSANINSGFSISYTAKSHIKAGIIGGYLVNANYWMDYPGPNETFTFNENQYIEFDGTEQDGTKSFDKINNIQLLYGDHDDALFSSDNVSFVFTFFNFSDTPISASFDLADSPENLSFTKAQYQFENSVWTNKDENWDSNIFTVPKSGFANMTEASEAINSYYQTIEAFVDILGYACSLPIFLTLFNQMDGDALSQLPPFTLTVVMFQFEIIDPAQSVDYSSSFSFTLQ